MNLTVMRAWGFGGLLFLGGCAALGGNKKDESSRDSEGGEQAEEIEAQQQVEAKEKWVGEVPRLVGRVVIVEANQKFVLFKRIGLYGFSQQSILSLVGDDGRTASLQLSGEKHGRYFAADISSGSPKAGDLIYARTLPPEE